MKHVAFVFDALIYYMRSGNDLDLKNAPGIVEQQQVNFFDHEQDFIDNKDDDRTKIWKFMKLVNMYQMAEIRPSTFCKLSMVLARWEKSGK